MDFSSIANPQGGQSQKHPTSILRNMLHDGDVKIYQDISGHAERIEIYLPKGKVVLIKDYEEVPKLASYKNLSVYSAQDEPLGSFDIFPVNRDRVNGEVRFFNGTSQIGMGEGNVGLAIASQLLNFSLPSGSSTSASVDSDVIASIKELL